MNITAQQQEMIKQLWWMNMEMPAGYELNVTLC